MASLNIAVVGENAQKRAEAAHALGKKSSEDDLAFYHTVFQGKIISAIDSCAYPQKLSSLLQAIELADWTLVLADAPSPTLGEIIVALDLLGAKTVFAGALDFGPLIGKTSLKESPCFSSVDEAKEFLLQQEPERQQGGALVLIDHCFEVKGVGTVALGVVKRGGVNVHDKLASSPLGREIEVKSMQKNDADVKAAEAGDRVGLSIKNAKAEEVERGTVLSRQELAAKKEIACEVSVSKFSRAPVISGASFHLMAGLQFEPCVVECVSEIRPGASGAAKIILQKPVCVVSGEKMLLCDLNAKGPRALACCTA